MSTDNTSTLANLLADGPITAVSFHTSAASRGTKAFAAELAGVLMGATTRKPLIITTDNAMTALYRKFRRPELLNSHGRNMAMSGGQRFADIDNKYVGAAHLDATWTDDSDLALPDGGKWLGRTPDNTLRHELPVFDTQIVSRAIEPLIATWTAAGKIVNIEREAPKPRTDAEQVKGPDIRDWRTLDELDRMRLGRAGIRQLIANRNAAEIPTPDLPPSEHERAVALMDGVMLPR